MNWVRNIGAVLGVVNAINGVLALIASRDSGLGKFYERTWYHMILGNLARPNVYDPFASGERFVIFHNDDLSNVERDFSAIRDAVGGPVFTVSRVESYNGDHPQGVIAFSDTLPDAQHKVRLMQAAVSAAKPKLNVTTPDNATVIVVSGGTSIGRFSTLEMFCRDYQTYAPSQLCF